MDFQWLQQNVITLAEKSPLWEIDINCDWQTGLDISEMIDGNSFKKKKLNEYFINLQIHKYKDSPKVKITLIRYYNLKVKHLWKWLFLTDVLNAVFSLFNKSNNCSFHVCLNDHRNGNSNHKTNTSRQEFSDKFLTIFLNPAN